MIDKIFQNNDPPWSAGLPVAGLMRGGAAGPTPASGPPDRAPGSGAPDRSPGSGAADRSPGSGAPDSRPVTVGSARRAMEASAPRCTR